VPELPEVESLAQFVAEKATGRVVDRTELASFAALKTFDPPFEGLRGRALVEAGRRGKFLLLRFGPLGGDADVWLVVHLSRAGWLQWKEPLPPGRAKPSPKSPLALRIGFEGGDGFDLTEAGTEKRLAAYVVRDPMDVPHVATLGPEALDLDVDGLAERLTAAGRSPLKAVLAEQQVIAGVGNAYSDEVLHVAQLSPFKPASTLTPDELVTLHTALHDVLEDALGRSAGVAASGLKQEKKGGLRVHGRKGEACPVCGDVVREVSYATKSFQYCATCQTGGKVLADRRLSRLLK
jgi:formamidopyrimidine-DNA glycosylase